MKGLDSSLLPPVLMVFLPQTKQGVRGAYLCSHFQLLLLLVTHAYQTLVGNMMMSCNSLKFNWHNSQIEVENADALVKVMPHRG